MTNEAIVVGVESRTSSPVRVPRDPVTLMHPQTAGLFPQVKVPVTPGASSLPPWTANVSQKQ